MHLLGIVLVIAGAWLLLSVPLALMCARYLKGAHEAGVRLPLPAATRPRCEVRRPEPGGKC